MTALRASPSASLLLLWGAATLACGGATDSSDTPAVPATVEISPRVDTVIELGSTVFTAVVKDASGRPIPGAAVTWWTLDTANAHVDGAGVVTGINLGRGVAAIHALAGLNVTDSVRVVVVPRPVARVLVHGPDSLLAADSVTLSLVFLDSLGRLLDPRPVRLSSTDTIVLRVGPLGDVRGLRGGTATIDADAGSAVGHLAVTVREMVFDSVWADGPTCAREVTGYLWCWGSNWDGVLGLPPDLVPGWPTPVRMGTERFRRAELGDAHGCGITLTGSVVCWGANAYGQLGLGNPGPIVEAPVPVPGTGALVNVTVGARHTCGWTLDGVASCWGSNNAGQLGVGDTLDRAVPSLVATALRFSQLSAGDEHTCGLEVGTGALHCWGEIARSGYSWDSTHACVWLVRCLQPIPVTGVPPLIVIASKGAGTCGLDGGVGVWCLPGGWDSIVHHAVDRTFTSLDAAEGIFCGIALDHQGYCYSGNHSGPLGRLPDDPNYGTTTVPIHGGHAFTRVAIGRTGQACGQAHGQVFCWGDNSLFQLGNRDPFRSDTAIIIIGHEH